MSKRIKKLISTWECIPGNTLPVLCYNSKTKEFFVGGIGIAGEWEDMTGTKKDVSHWCHLPKKPKY